MLFNIEFWNMEKYLPTKRHRKLRERYVRNSIDVEIKEVTEKEFQLLLLYMIIKVYMKMQNHTVILMETEIIECFQKKSEHMTGNYICRLELCMDQQLVYILNRWNT